MWTRAELKKRAIGAYRRNVLACIIVALILTMLSSSGSSGNDNNNDNNNYNGNNSFMNEIVPDYPYQADPYENIGIGAGSSLVQNTLGVSSSLGYLAAIVTNLMSHGIFLLFAAIILVIAILLNIFVFAPLVMGCHRFFLINAQENASLKEILFPFRSGYYMNIVKILFLRDLKLFGWTLLLIIPGIIKTYEYKMIPYLLAENPAMDSNEVFAATRTIMDGQKLDTYILELSFLLWTLLSAVTLGLAGLVFVNPYRAQTEAELYLALTDYPTSGQQDYYQSYYN